MIFCVGIIVVSCDVGDRVSGTEYIGGIKVEYFDVKQETRDSLNVTLRDFIAMLDDEKNFLKDVEFSIAHSYDNLDDAHSLKIYLKGMDENEKDDEHGRSFFSDNRIKKIVIVQEETFGFSEKFLCYVNGLGYTAIPSIRRTLMHEIGHQFDEYFGHDHQADFVKKWNDLMCEKEKNKHQNPYDFILANHEKEIYTYYKNHSGLSDRDDFKQAFYEDLKYIAIMYKKNPDRLPGAVSICTKELDVGNYTINDVERADDGRAEAYANLFAYTFVGEDGDKEDFIEAFKNAYRIVRKDIEAFLLLELKREVQKGY